MPKYLSDYINSRDNNFNLLRFVAATLVLFSHSYPLSGNPHEPLGSIIRMSFGVVAVDVFFITSGLLVTKSLFDRKDIVFFIWSRILRIFPALIVAVLFCVFVVGVYFTTLPLDEYFKHADTYKFIRRNITLYNGVFVKLPGVFSDIPWKHAVNGSLWTLPKEIKMYFIVAVVGLLLYIKPAVVSEKKAKFAFVLIFVVSLLWLYYQFAFSFPKTRHDAHISRFLAMFFVGATFYILANRIALSFRIVLIALGFLIYFAGKHSPFFVIYFLVIGYITIYLAYVPAGILRKYNKFGDYSYGMYIYAFPVQQSLAASIDNISTAKMIVLSFIITLCLAILSWHFVEKPMLAKKHFLPNVMGKLDIKRLTR